MKYKDGWTDAQKAAADAKVKALTEAHTEKIHVERSGPSASKIYKDAHGVDSVPKGSDVDHVIDLQLGGKNDVSNMSPLDSSVNRSLGAQIMHAITVIFKPLYILLIAICKWSGEFLANLLYSRRKLC